MCSRIGLAALQRAAGDIGKGEQGYNNGGPYVRSLRGYLNPHGQGAWCAAAVYTWVLYGCRDIGSRFRVARTHSARRLVARYLEAGASCVELPLPGDIVLWSRKLPWQGHVGIVSAASGLAFSSIEGNKGKFPAKVAEFKHRIDEPRLIRFVRLP